MKDAVHIPAARHLPETVRTLRALGLGVSKNGILTITSASPQRSAKTARPQGPGPLLVPDSASPARTLALLRKLGAGTRGPFFAAGRAGRINAALFAAACLAGKDSQVRRALDRFRDRQTSSVPIRP